MRKIIFFSTYVLTILEWNIFIEMMLNICSRLYNKIWICHWLARNIFFMIHLKLELGWRLVELLLPLYVQNLMVKSNYVPHKPLQYSLHKHVPFRFTKKGERQTVTLAQESSFPNTKRNKIDSYWYWVSIILQKDHW